MNTAERYTQVVRSLKSELGSSERDLLDEALKLQKELTKIQVTSDEALGQSNYFKGLLKGLSYGIAKQFDKSSDTDREFLKEIHTFIKKELEGSNE